MKRKSSANKTILRDAVSGRFVTSKHEQSRTARVDAAYKDIERKYGRTLTDLSK